ncbi:MAG TPA: hypothetical protein VLA94_04625, partial [Syntrophales bacterium]|nr:hypothetical protein [Syntrophales bacterium]
FAFSFTPFERTQAAWPDGYSCPFGLHPSGQHGRPSCSFVAGYGRRMVKIYNPTFRNVKCEMRRFEKYEKSIRRKKAESNAATLDIRTLVARSPAPVDK